MKNLFPFIIAMIFLTIRGGAQVAVNTDQALPDVSAMLDVKSTQKGFLMPRMSYTEMNTIFSPAKGLAVFCTTTNQYYFNRGTPLTPNWVCSFYLPFAGSFSTTTTLLDLKNTGTGGTAAFSIDNTANTSPVISAVTDIGNAISAYNYSATYSTLWAQNDGGSTAIVAKSAGGNALYAENASPDYYTFWAQNNNARGPVIGIAAASGNALYAENASDSICTLFAKNKNNWSTIAAMNIRGNSIYAENASDSNCTFFAKNASSNAINTIYAENSGAYPTILGYNAMTSGDRSGGYFSAGAAYAWVGANFSGTSYKVVGTGSVATIVTTPAGEKVTMFCPEAPEILLSDYGTGLLTNGKCHIELDPVFSNNIMVSDKHPMKVFIQAEGDCNGVFVINKTTTGFDVVEFNNGTSGVPFSWSVIASRSDENDKDGVSVSKNSGVRFPLAPKPQKKMKGQMGNTHRFSPSWNASSVQR